MGADKYSFALFVVDKLRGGEKIKVLEDQYVSPTLNTLLAKALAEIVELRLMSVLDVAGKRMSMLESARKIAEKLGLPVENIEPARIQEFTWKAKKPRDSSLNTSKVSRLLEASFNDMDLALEIFAKELGKEGRGIR